MHASFDIPTDCDAYHLFGCIWFDCNARSNSTIPRLDDTTDSQHEEGTKWADLILVTEDILGKELVNDTGALEDVHRMQRFSGLQEIAGYRRLLTSGEGDIAEVDSAIIKIEFCTDESKMVILVDAVTDAIEAVLTEGPIRRALCAGGASSSLLVEVDQPVCATVIWQLPCPCSVSLLFALWLLACFCAHLPKVPATWSGSRKPVLPSPPPLPSMFPLRLARCG